MTSRIRAAALALVAAVGLLAAPLLMTASVSAAVPSAASFVVFSHVPEPEPALAETGVDSSIALTAGAGFLFLGATALVLIRTRRVERSL